MLAVELRFPAGRVHATPWGRHVNEGEVEWPPSPWRLARGLVAAWQRRPASERAAESRVDALLSTLARELPRYRLPDVTAAHTRHYMPRRSGKGESQTLVFDGFLSVSRTEPLVVCWPSLQLAPEALALLDDLLTSLPYLGRAESWVVAQRVEEPDASLEMNAVPADADESGEPEAAGVVDPVETVRLLAPILPERYAAWRSQYLESSGLATKRGKSRELVRRTLPESWRDAVCVESGDLQALGWSRPPAARWIRYLRPLVPSWRPSPVRPWRRRPAPRIARFALAGAYAPPLVDGLRLAEALRAGAMSASREIRGNASPILSGKSDSGEPLQRQHAHAHYLFEDGNRDGCVDHLLVWVPCGMEPDDCRALDRLRRLWMPEGAPEWQLVLEHLGDVESVQPHSALLRPSRVWESATPYLLTRHPKRHRDGRLKLRADGTWIDGPDDQLVRDLGFRGIAAPERIEWLDSISARGRPLRPLQFRRFRRAPGRGAAASAGRFARITFALPVAGPLVVGAHCHFGLGAFRSDA